MDLLDATQQRHHCTLKLIIFNCLRRVTVLFCCVGQTAAHSSVHTLWLYIVTWCLIVFYAFLSWVLFINVFIFFISVRLSWPNNYLIKKNMYWSFSRDWQQTHFGLKSTQPHMLAERHSCFLSVFHSRWDVTVSYQRSRLPGTQRYSTHTHKHTHWDGWACQSAEQTAAQSLAVWFSPTTAWLTLQALRSVERISLHLHRKHCHGFHFSISLCTYIHLLINPACSNQTCKHVLIVVRGACWQQGQKIVPVMALTLYAVKTC